MEDQEEQHQKWWLKNKRLLISTIITIIAILIAFALLVYWFGWDWTGFNSGESKITITSTPQGTTIAKELQPAKSLWDWLQLLGILAIPVVVGLGTVWFTSRQTQASEANRAQQAKESEANRQKRHETDLEIAEKNREREHQTALQITADNQHEAAFRAYIDKMSELLVEKKLGESAPDDQVRKIARVQTLAVLLGLDGMRKGIVLQFLYESGLIEKDNRIVDLSYADLSSANLNAFDLSRADLSKVNLREADLFLANLSGTNLNLATLTAANLFEANLNGANLVESFLNGADLSFADLSGANLRGTIFKGTNLQGTKVTSKQLDEATFFENVTMPDGSIHP